MNIVMKLLLFICLTFITKQVFANCQTAEYRQFDFWLGTWQVTNKLNKNISSNKVSSINNGCGLLEEYTTESGYQGKSLNIYDQTDGLWHQTWVDTSGLRLVLAGRWQEKQGNMVLEGKGYDKNMLELLNKIIWTPLDNGTIRQQWLQSRDQGKTWQSIFDGIYRKI